MIIVGLGLSLRLYGYNWGTPLLLHSDEHVIVDQAYDLIKRNSWEPLSYYGTPDQLSIYSLSLVFRVMNPLLFHGESATITFSQHPQTYYYIGRILTAILGTLTIIIVYLIGVEFSFLTGILNALLFAIFPLYVLHAHYVTPDVPITFLATVVMYLLIKYIKSHKQKYIWIATIVAALSVTEKYPAVANFAMVGLVYLLANRESIWKYLLRGFGLLITFSITLFLAAPFLFIRYQRTLSWLKQESRTENLGVQILGFVGNLRYYANDFYFNSGLILSLFALMGVVIAIKYKKILFIPLSLGIVYWLGLSAVPLHWSRWGLPMYLTPILFAALAISYLLTKLNHSQYKYILTITLTFTMLAQLALNRFNLIKLNAKDTRVVALSYFKEHAITKENSIYEGYTPQTVGVSTNSKYDLNELKNTKIKYIVLSSYRYGFYLKESKDGIYKKNIEFYNKVTEKKLLTKFESKCVTIPYKSKIPELSNLLGAINKNCIVGPELKIYQP